MGLHGIAHPNSRQRDLTPFNCVHTRAFSNRATQGGNQDVNLWNNCRNSLTLVDWANPATYQSDYLLNAIKQVQSVPLLCP